MNPKLQMQLPRVNTALRPLVALLLIISLVSLAGSELSAQQLDEFVLKRQTVKKVDKSIERLAKKGYIPMDAIAESNGRRATFTIRMVKPPASMPWFAKFDLTDAQFEATFEQNKQKKLRVVWHEIYQVKKEWFHACIWHYDKAYQPLTEEALMNADVKPEPRPVGVIWNPDTRIPVVANGHVAFSDLERRSLEFMRANQMPALSVAVSIGGNIQYEGSFGYSDLETRLGIKEGQPIRTCSVSRLLTVVAVLQLVDRGKLKLDQPVYPLLGIEPWKKEAFDARSNKITVLNLLQETSGYHSRALMDPGFQPRNITGEMKLKETVTPIQSIQYMLSKPLASNPGEKYSDSSYGFFLLGRVIEKISGEDYEQFVLKNIAKPLNLRSLTMSRTDPDQRTKHEVINVFRPGTWKTQLAGKDSGKWVLLNRGGYHFGLLDASQGWMSNAGDILRLTNAIQKNPSPILSNRSKALLIAKPQCVLDQEAEEEKAKILWKGCSVYCQSTSKGVNIFLHSGAASGFAGVSCHPGTGVSRCYIFNCPTTIAGENPRDGYDLLLWEEAYRVRKTMLGK